MGATYSFKNFTDLTEQESDEVLQGRNDAEVRRWMTSDRVITPDEHRRFMAALKTTTTQTYLRVERNGHFVGVYSMTDMTSASGVGGFWISPYARGKMLGLSVVFHSIDYLFQSMPIESIQGYQLSSNVPAARLNRMLGFEATVRPEQSDDRMIYLLLTRTKWARVSAEGTAIRNLVELSERRA